MSDTWKISISDSKCDLPQPTWWSPSVLLSDGQILIAGGQIPSVSSEKFEEPVKHVGLFHPTTCTYIDLQPLAEFHAGTEAIVTPGQIYFFGGSSSPAIEVYSVAEKSVVSAGQMTAPRSGSAQVLLQDGNILITGGYDKSSANSGPMASAEIYNPKTQVSTPIANMNFKRATHSATLLPDGRVLLVGGAGDGLTSAEIFNPQSATFTPVQGLPSGRKDHRVALDRDGRIWFVGGTSTDDSQPRELFYFDSRTASFVTTSLVLSEGREDGALLYSSELHALIFVGGQKRGTIDGKKNPPVANVDVIDLAQNRVYSSVLPAGPRDDGAISLVSSVSNAGIVEILVYSGVQEIYDAEGRTIGKKTPQPEMIRIER